MKDNFTLDLARDMARQLVKADDTRMKEYIEVMCTHIEARGDDIAKYALVRVANPMQYKKDSVKLDWQYRLVHIDELENVPVYEDD